MSYQLEIPPALFRRAQKLARREGKDEASLLVDLLEQALLQAAGKPIFKPPSADVEREYRAYISLHPQLKQTHFGRHVAIFQGKLIDHDADETALFERIDEAYPDEFVWMCRVEAEPERHIQLYTPTISRAPADPDTDRYR